MVNKPGTEDSSEDVQLPECTQSNDITITISDFVDANIRILKGCIYGAAGITTVWLAWKLHVFHKFTHVKSIPLEHFERNVKLRGKVMSYDASTAVFQIDHVPIITTPFRKKSDPSQFLKLRLLAVQPTESGHAWIQQNLVYTNDSHVKFRLVPDYVKSHSHQNQPSQPVLPSVSDESNYLSTSKNDISNGVSPGSYTSDSTGVVDVIVYKRFGTMPFRRNVNLYLCKCGFAKPLSQTLSPESMYIYNRELTDKVKKACFQAENRGHGDWPRVSRWKRVQFTFSSLLNLFSRK